MMPSSEAGATSVHEIWARADSSDCEAPCEAMRNVAASVVLENAAHDEQCFARIAELQDHARTVAQNMSLAHGVFDHDNRGNETPFIYKLAALHGQLVNDAFYETLRDKAQLFRTGLDKVQSEASEAWDHCLAERLQLVSEHITFVRASYEDKLARARRHGADLVATERKRQTEERSQLQQRLEASHRRETSRLHHEHGLIRRELEQNLGAERRKTQALSNTMLTKNAKLKQLEARCKELVQEITSLRDQLESQAGELEGKTANAQMFIAILQKQLRVALDSVEKLEADVEARDEQIKELDAQVGTLTSERDGLVAKLESTEAVLQVFREDLAMCQQDLGLERDARCIAEQNADTLSHELAESQRNLDELKTAHIELTCDLRRSEASLEKERMLRHEEANQHLEQVGIWQQKVNVETGKVKELQFGMQEYAKLQQRYRELDVQRQEAEEQLRMEREAHAREREEAVCTAAAQLEQNANEETKDSHATPESLPSRQMTAAQFMSRLTQARTTTNDSAEPEDGMEITPKDNEVVEDQVFFLETERLRGRMEQELRQTLEREVREEIRRKCAETMQADLEKRLRKEFEARNRIAVQRAVNAELARLAPLESKWAEVLRKHRQALDEVSIRAGRSERKFSHLNSKLENSKADCEALRSALREKDRVMLALTDNLQRARVRTEKLLPQSSSTNQLDVALVCLADPAKLQALWDTPASNHTMQQRPRTAPSSRLQAVLTEVTALDDIECMDGPQKCGVGTIDVPKQRKKSMQRTRSASRVAAEKQAAGKRQIVFGHRAVRALQSGPHRTEARIEGGGVTKTMTRNKR